MGDESFDTLDGKSLSNLRVVDLKRELEKRGLPKSGSKKDLIKRLKQKLELEKLFSESSAAGSAGTEPRLQLDEATEQNEFVRQYLENQQKLYAQQKGIIEQQGRVDTEEDDECEEDEESDSGSKTHENDVSENVSVAAIKNTCDSSTYEIAEEAENKTQEETALAKSPSITSDCTQVEPKKETQILKSESDQESCGSGKPDSTATNIEPNRIDQDQPSLVLGPDKPSEMHPKKSKLRKHCDSLQKNVTEPEDATGNDSKTDGSDTSMSYDKKCLSGHENEPSLNAEMQGQSKPPENSVNRFEDTKQDTLDSGHLEVGNGKKVIQESTNLDIPENIKSSTHQKELCSGFVENVDTSQEGMTIEMSENNGSAIEHCESAASPEKEPIFPTPKSESEDQISLSESKGTEMVDETIPKVQINDQDYHSDHSSETEDGESKTDDENSKSVQVSDSLNKVVQQEEMKKFSEKQAESDSSTDSDSSSNDTRHKHKSYKSPKKLCKIRNKTQVEDLTSRKLDDAADKEKEDTSDVRYTPRRLKIKLSPIVPQQIESKAVKDMKSEDSSPEKTKKEKQVRNEITPPSKSARKERSPKRTPSILFSSSVLSCSEIDKLFASFSKVSSEIDDNQNKERDYLKIQSKKRCAEDPASGDHTPAKVTYRKLNISFKKNEEQDSKEQMLDKKRLWRSFGSKTAVNISTDSLKTIIPDFKVVCGPSLNEAEEMPSPKIASDAPSLANTFHDNSYSEESVEKIEVDEDLKSKDFKKGGSECHRRTVLSKKPVSQILFIHNLVRPFTLLQLKELLKRTGKLIEEEFWIDKIKSKCFVMYETKDQAEETKEALNGTRWPPSNPKILVVDFATKEEMEYQKKSAEQMKTGIPALPLQTRLEKQEDMDASRKRREIDDPIGDQHSRQNAMYIREWDKDKLTQEESPDKDKILPALKDKPRSSEKKKDRKDGKRKQEDDTPAKLLDDLFHKTKTTPCIYWLPLTEEQAKEKEEQRRLRRLERERRNQEEEEQQRARRRRESRSRSPVRRR